MTITSPRRSAGHRAACRRVLPVLLLVLAHSARVAAQGAPGWTFTPTLTVSGLHDDNVTLFGKGSRLAGDYSTTYEPRADLQHVGKYGTFGLGYQAAFLAYRDLNELNRWAQGAHAEIRRQVTAHTLLFARENVATMPTTDLIELGGIPFRRAGAKVNDLAGGLQQALTRRTSLTASYRHQWLQFDRDPGSFALRGGQAHEVAAGVRHRVTERVAIGGDYSFRRALITGGTVPFDIHNAGGALEVRAARDWTVNGSFGFSSLMAQPGQVARTDPAWSLSLTGRPERVVVNASYLRTFMPAFGYGGTVQSEEVGASLRVPLVGQDRLTAEAAVSWRRDAPLTTDLEQQLPLRSLRFHASLGYALQRWLRLEGFYARVQQDTRLPGGALSRNRIGFQVVTSKPLRIQ
jgi:hypothetical protein